MFRSSIVILSLLTSSVGAFTVSQKASVKPLVSLAEKSDFFMEDTKGGSTEAKPMFKKDVIPGDGDCEPEEEFCMVDGTTGKNVRLTLEEKERIFMDSLQSYYFSGRQVLTDADFDLLKEDLEWNGSPLVAMSQKEVKYLAAMQEYTKGTPVMSDEEFDQLKTELRDSGSKFAVDVEPKCFIDTGICKVNFQVDDFRNNLLYLPAGSILFFTWLFLGYELLHPLFPVSPFFLAVLGSYPVFNGAKYITENLVFQDKTILYGPCPNCSAENRVYFGDILGVKGHGDVAQVKCPNCKETYSLVRDTMRASTLPK